MNVYLDLNIFDQIEKIHRLENPDKGYYKSLLGMIECNQVTTAFSNAHLNDLFRGYQKNKEYVRGHLDNITMLTKKLCICQYWGESKMTWHYRDVFDFFQNKVVECDDIPNNYEGLFKDFLKWKALMYFTNSYHYPPTSNRVIRTHCLELCFLYQKHITTSMLCKLIFSIFKQG